MYKIAAVGDRDSVLGFASIGLDVFPCDEPGTGYGLLKKLVKEDYAVIFLTESLAAEIGQKQLEKFYSQPLPALTLIPGAHGSTGEGMKAVSGFVEQAVGSNIL